MKRVILMFCLFCLMAGIGFCNKLEELRFPESLQYIGYDSLSECVSLKKIYFEEGFKDTV